MVNALGGGKLAFVDSSPLDGLLQPLAHVFELKVRARLRTGVLAIGVVVKVDALVVHQV